MNITSREPAAAKHLREATLFRGLAPDVLEPLIPHVFTQSFAAGDYVLRAGDYFDGAYLLIAGRVEARMPVTGATPKDDSARAVAGVPVPLTPGRPTLLGPGELFGEGSALTRYPIGFDLRAVTDVRCLLLKTQALRAMFDVPELATFKDLFEARYKERTLASHLRGVNLFEDLDTKALQELISRAELLTFKPGARIATEGDPCDAFYLVRGGFLQASVKTGSAETAITYLRVGEFVGEASLLVDVPWPFSLSAIENVELVRVSQRDLRSIVPSVTADRRLWDVMVERLRTRGRTIENPTLTQTMQMAIDTGLARGGSVLLIDLDRCTRCDECVNACADTHQGVPRLVREGARFGRFSVPTACYHCADPVCMVGCPTGAITRPLGTFQVVIDEATCIGCGNCVNRCPWDNILTRPVESKTLGKVIEVATKCDLCVGRPEGPACVQMCPQGCAERVDFKDHVRVNQLLSGS